MSARPGEPSAAALGGAGWPAALRRAFLATRPQFLTASALPVIAGTAWGASVAGGLDPVAFVLALAATMLVQAGSNVFNDVADELGGSDPINAGRIYPFTGGSRFIQNGILSVAQMRRLATSLFGLAGLIGVLLALREGAAVLGFGLAGLGLGLLYSWPGPMLAGRGLGELSVALAFGPLPVAGAAWLQAPAALELGLLLGVPVGCWVAAILLINEVPDIDADRAVGKRTLPVRLGRPATAWLYAGLQAGALAGAIAWQRATGLPLAAVALPGLLLAAGLVAARAIARDRPPLVAGIRLTLLIHAVGCLGLTGAILLGGAGP